MKILLLFLVVWAQHQAAETDHRSLAELNIGEVQNLENIANLGEDAGLARLQARSILNFFYGYGYEDEPKLPATAPALRQAETDTTTEQPITIATELKPALTLSPNPANNWVKVQYVLLAEPTEAAILITNTQGSIIYQQTIVNTTGELVYDSKSLPSGVYFVVLKCRGQEPLVQKLIIIR